MAIKFSTWWRDIVMSSPLLAFYKTNPPVNERFRKWPLMQDLMKYKEVSSQTRIAWWKNDIWKLHPSISFEQRSLKCSLVVWEAFEWLRLWPWFSSHYNCLELGPPWIIPCVQANVLTIVCTPDLDLALLSCALPTAVGKIYSITRYFLRVLY